MAKALKPAADRAIRAAVVSTFAQSSEGEVSTAELYRQIGLRTGLGADVMKTKGTVGTASPQEVNLAHRTARWAQQSLKKAGLIERVDYSRGLWRVTAEGKEALRMVNSGHALVAFSTPLGVAVWCDCREGAKAMTARIHLCAFSPPFGLLRPNGRLYGNPGRDEYVEFIMSALRAINDRLLPGASVVMNISPALHEPNSPSRSTIPARLVVEVEKEFGWGLMDWLPWHNASAPPGPTLYASRQRVHLNAQFDFNLWFCTEPKKVMSDNRRVLQPHSERHERLMRSGGETRHRRSADGSHTVRVGSYSNVTPGKIPGNVLRIGHRCESQSQYKRRARELGLPVHGAPMSLTLARFLVDFLCPPGGHVVELFSGSGTFPKACEDSGRTWEAYDIAAEYLRGSAERFEKRWVNPELNNVLGLMNDPKAGGGQGQVMAETGIYF